MADELAAPGPALRDPAYQDLCAFFATLPDGADWVLHPGDWVVYPPSAEPLIVLAYDAPSDRLSALQSGGDRPSSLARAGAIWLPTLPQLHALIRRHFGTSGFFNSAFNGSTYWYTGQMLGMTVTNMQPLAEGSSPEEAALKALLMRYQR